MQRLGVACKCSIVLGKEEYNQMDVEGASGYLYPILREGALGARTLLAEDLRSLCDLCLLLKCLLWKTLLALESRAYLLTFSMI